MTKQVGRHWDLDEPAVAGHCEICQGDIEPTLDPSILIAHIAKHKATHEVSVRFNISGRRLNNSDFEKAFEELSAFLSQAGPHSAYVTTPESVVDRLFPEPTHRKALIARLRIALRTLHDQLRDTPDWDSGRLEVKKLEALIAHLKVSRARMKV
jgi:hypothetical protein